LIAIIVCTPRNLARKLQCVNGGGCRTAPVCGVLYSSAMHTTGTIIIA
jgi:hypothetical protein